MSILSNLRREWRAYLSKRWWVLGALLILLCALALVQYYWIGQITQAERQRAATSLATALSNLENDFDIEITRAFAAFGLPTPSGTDYRERYNEWVRLAPYPNLILGVYVLGTGASSSLKAVTPGAPTIASTEWRGTLPGLPSPFGFALASGSVDSAGVGFGGFEGPRQVQVSAPELMIDGNPAFAFPTMPPIATTKVTWLHGAASHPQWLRGITATRVGPPGGRAGLPQWVVVVLDGNYLRTTFLPRLVQLHFPGASSPDYDFLVLSNTPTGERRVVFHSALAPPESQFLHADGRISLFGLRLDCLLPSDGLNHGGIAQVPPVAVDGLAEILAQRPPGCRLPGAAWGSSAKGRWEMFVRYRAGSLDQAMATFRRRSLLLSCGVLVVLALGILMLIILTERARALAEMQTEFVLGVSHDLRTPLTVIRVAADNLRKGMVENPQQAFKYGEIINAQASELSRMIEETLAFARMQSTTLVRNGGPVSPEQIVKTSLARWEDALRDARVDVELQLEPNLFPVDVEVRLMSSCLENLIQNVLKYANVGRWMAIRAKQVKRPEGQRVQISVADRGPGISAVDLPHIFEPFYRGNPGEDSQVHGLGLGLTLVKRVVEAHHGTVEVESSDISGTVVSLFLPLHRAQPGAQKIA